MFDGDLDNLDLGSKRKTTVWVATATPASTTKPQRKGGGRCRKNGKESKHGCVRRNSGSSSEYSSMDDVHALREEHGICANVLCLDAEVEDGPIEYKQKLDNPNPTRFEQLVTQMQFRLMEGCGQCKYYIGVHDDGYCLGLTPSDLDASLAVVKKMANVLKASIRVQEYLPGRPGRQCAIVEIKTSVNENITSADLRIAVAGTIDSGKSTLIAVLTHGSGGRPLLDNGLGSARTNILKHKHEIESGRTSSISEQLLGYDSEGRVLNYAGVSSFTPYEIGTTSSRQIHFIDMGGHEKYLKTAFYGLTSMLPDYMILSISAISGMGRITREQLAVALALDIPTAVVLTMTDLASSSQINAILEKLENLVQCAGEALSGHLGVNFQDFKGGLEFILDEQKAETYYSLRQPSRIGLWKGQLPLSIPIFHVSNVTGEGLAVLHAFLRGLQPMSVHQIEFAGSSSTETGSSDSEDADDNSGSCFIVDQTFDLQSVGMVVSGTAVDGDITVGQELNLGPDNLGKFVPVTVESIQRSQVPVMIVKSGQTATLAVNANPGTCQPDKRGKSNSECKAYLQSNAGDDVYGVDQNSNHADESYRIHGHAPHGSDGATPPRSPSSSSLKGRVLLDSTISMITTQEFESVIILLGGHWPARGLLSAKWPPSEDGSDTMPSANDSGLSRKHPKKKNIFSATVHMGNIRQTAHIASMEELEVDKRKGCKDFDTLPASLLAAAAVVNAGQGYEMDTAVARIVFRFATRAEWVREGARFITRDQSDGGSLSGIGIVVRTLHSQE